MDAATPAPSTADRPGGAADDAEIAADDGVIEPGGPRFPWRSPPNRAGSLIHSGVSVRGYYLMHALGASVPLAAGIALFGWRAAVCVTVVVASAAFALLIWRNIGSRGGQIQPAQTLWTALLLALMLPAHLATDVVASPEGHNLPGPPWTLLVAGGFGVVILLWLIGGAGTGRFHVTLCAYLLLFAVFAELMMPCRVLARSRLGGDLLKTQPGQPRLMGDAEPWLERSAIAGHDAFWVEPAAPALTNFTRGDRLGEQGRVPMSELLRDRVPPLEDLVIGGQAAPIGLGSAIAVVVGGLFLLYRGLIDFRIPLLLLVFFYAALLVLPVPTVVTDVGGDFHSLMQADQPDVVWGQAITFANYELTASPALFTAFFLATSPNIRPLARRARAIYAVLVGVAMAAAQLYVSAMIGPYLALMAVALFAPLLDRWFAPRTLV
jgi:electron transport complex protein RnfD